MPESITESLPARRGHFLFESGHHGDLWLELDPLWNQPERLRPCVAALARQLAPHQPDALCGPQTGGARLAELVAAHLGRPWYATEKMPPAPTGSGPDPGPLYRATYALAPADRTKVWNQRIAVIDDVINAGSATRATVSALIHCGALPIALSALLVLNDHAARLAAEHHLPLVSLDQRASNLWTPSDCPLCAQGVPLTRPN